MKERTAAFFQLGLTLVAMVLIMAFAREFDRAIGFGILLLASILVLWRIVRGPQNQAEEKYGVFPSWVSALPKKWQKRVLGEKDEPKNP